MQDRREFSLIVGYASDMGAAEYVAMQLADACKERGILAVDVAETELNDIPLADLQAATHFVAVSSTFGDGEFPDNGTVFWEELSAAGAARLDHKLKMKECCFDGFCNFRIGNYEAALEVFLVNLKGLFTRKRR